MPWLDELFPPEDSLDLLERRGRKRGAELEIAVLKLPSLSNFSDLDPLEAEPSVQLRWVAPGEELGNPDAVVVPGSKQTLRDLDALRMSATLCSGLQQFAAAGGAVFGICGGMQLLGRELCDPEGLEGGSNGLLQATGLNLLPLRTVFGGSKALRQRNSTALWPLIGDSSKLPIEGFELHRGSTTTLEPCQPLCADAELGWVHGSVAGTYLHGVFESGPWRRRWLNQLRARKGLPMLSEQQPHHSRQRDALLDRLADAFEQHVNLEPLLQQP